MVFCGYMPYGWLGPVVNGLSDLAMVAKDAVELTDSRCCKGVACELGPRGGGGMPGLRSSCDIEFRGNGTFAVLFRVATLRRSTESADFVGVICGRAGSFRSWSCRSLFQPSVVPVGRKPSLTEGMKSSSSWSSAYSSSKTSGLLGGRWGWPSLELRRSIASVVPDQPGRAGSPL